MSEADNLQVVKNAYDAFGRGDIAAILSSLTDDVTWHLVGPSEIPYAGLRQGRDGAAEFFRLLGESDDVALFEPRRSRRREPRRCVRALRSSSKVYREGRKNRLGARV